MAGRSTASAGVGAMKSAATSAGSRPSATSAAGAIPRSAQTKPTGKTIRLPAR
ncbi:MAG TPA: hypothetical protein VIL85_08855 [Thermomicrobiales bacterium]